MLRYQSHKEEEDSEIRCWNSFKMRKSISEPLLGDNGKPNVHSLEIPEHKVVDVFSICLDNVANLGGEDAITGRRL